MIHRFMLIEAAQSAEVAGPAGATANPASVRPDATRPMPRRAVVGEVAVSQR